MKMTNEIQSPRDLPRPGDESANSIEPHLMREDVLTSLHRSGYSAPLSQINVSVTSEKTIRLTGKVANYFLKQKALCFALSILAPEQLEDHIEVL